MPSGVEWELLLVDNGDLHPVAPVAAGFADRLPIRVCREPVAGISNARNRGANTASGRYLVWTDDDVEVDPSWLAAYVAAFAKWPDAGFFGGAATPVFEPPQQLWMDRFQDLLGPMLAKRGPQSDAEITADDLPYGLNFATKASVQQQFPFNPERGRAPGRQIAGEETDLLRRMIAAGHHGRWVPSAQVKHIIPAERQTVKYLYDYYFAAGQEFVIRDREQLNSSAFTRAAILVKAAVLSLSLLIPLASHYGVGLRRAHAFNMGAAALLRSEGPARRV